MKALAENIFAQTAMYGISVILMRGLSFFMLPYVIHTLSPKEFGLLELLTTMAVLSSVILSMGLEHALYRFVGDKKSKEDRSRVVSQIYSLCLFLCFMVLILNPMLSQLGSQLFADVDITSILAIVFLSLSFETLVSVPLAWLRMSNRCVAFCVSSLLWTALRAFLVVIFLRQGLGLLAIFLSGLVATSIVAFLLYVLIRRDITRQLNGGAYRDYLRYGIPILGSGILAFFLNGYDRWVLVSYVDTEQIAYYALAAKFALLVSLSMQPYGMWYMPKRFDVLNAHNGLARSRTFSLLGIHLVLWVALGVGSLAPIFVNMFLPPVYQASIPLIHLFVFWACFKEMSEYVNLGCLISKNTHMQLGINLFVTVLGVILMSLLAPVWGMLGVLIGLCIAHYLRFVLFFVISQRRLALSLPLNKISVLTFTLIAILLAHSMHASEGISELFVRAVLGMSIFALISFVLFFKECRALIKFLPERRLAKEV